MICVILRNIYEDRERVQIYLSIFQL